MAMFRIQPHGRIQEWVAEEKGYFTDEGLDYEFIRSQQRSAQPSVTSSDQAPVEVKRGAFEGMEAGRACEISSACHWAVNMAAHGEHGRMWGHAYSVTPAGLWVAPESDIKKPEDLAGIEVAVGYHSGSHFSALQGMEQFLPKDQIKLQFVGGPGDRCQLALDRRVQVANVFGTLDGVQDRYKNEKDNDKSNNRSAKKERRTVDQNTSDDHWPGSGGGPAGDRRGHFLDRGSLGAATSRVR